MAETEKKKRGAWSYDPISGGLYKGAKIVTWMYSESGIPIYGNVEETNSIGKLIAETMEQKRLEEK